MFTLESVVDELLGVEKKEEPVKSSFFERIHNFARRKDIEKEIHDEIENENNKTIKLGHDAEAFLASNWYSELLEPQIRQTIKSGLQSIIREGETMTEVQLKTEIASIRKALSIVASLRLKIIRARQLKEDSRAL